VVAVHVLEVPETEPLEAPRQTPREVERLLERAVDYARRRGATVRPVIKVGHRTSHSLVQTAREEECNFLVIGESQARSVFERIVATIVERVLQRAPCQVAVVYGDIAAETISDIAVPVTTGRNSELAARLAPSFADWFSAESRALTMLDPSMSEDEKLQLVEAAKATVGVAQGRLALETARVAATERGFLLAIAPGELVLIGAPSSGPVVPIVGETLPGAIARQLRNPMIVVRAVEERNARGFERMFFTRT